MNLNMEKNVEMINTFIMENRFDEALDYIEKLPAKERNRWEIDNLMGIICTYCGDNETAVSFFKNALKKNSDSINLYFNLADTYMRMGRYEHAELMIKCCEHLAFDEDEKKEIETMRSEIEKVFAKDENNKNKVLMIPYYYPPLSGSGVFRSIKFVKYISEMGWEPTVISTDMPPKGWEFRDDSLLKEIPEGIDVFRIPDKISSQRENVIGAEKVKEAIGFIQSIFKSDIEALNIVKTILSKEGGINKMMSFPCSCLCWCLDVIKHIEENMDINGFNVVYTTSGPASSHLIGYYLKEKYGIPWVADYRDAWTYNPYGNSDIDNNINTRLLYKLEGILLKKANRNITYADCMLTEYINKFGLSYDKLDSITNGYDEEDFKEFEISNKKTDKFTINYSGLLYTAQRNIEPVLQAIKQLIEEKKIEHEKIRFKVVGQGNESHNEEVLKKYGLTNIFEQTGYVNHLEALKANCNADMLLLLVGNEDKFKSVFTGKVFEYLRSGKPILALAPRDGEVDRMLSLTGHGETYYSYEINQIKEMILSEYNNWLERNENQFIKSPYIKFYDRRYLTMKLADIFYDVTVKSNKCIIKEKQALITN